MDPFDWIYELELKSKLSSEQKEKWEKIVLHKKNSLFYGEVDAIQAFIITVIEQQEQCNFIARILWLGTFSTRAR